MEELRLSTLKQVKHGSLRGLGRRGVISYVHGEDYYIVVCVFQAHVKLAGMDLREPERV
jgi:hypothetical protein